MKSVSARLPDDVAEKFDKIVLARKLQGEDISKSEVMRELVSEWVEENEEILDEYDVGE